MADLDQVLASVLASLANARRMADEQTSVIAQYYQANPLLQGMTVPRIRLPEVVIDLPLVIDGVEAGKAPEVADTHTIVAAALDTLSDKAWEREVSLTAASRETWARALQPAIERAVADSVNGRLSSQLVQEAVANAAEGALHPLLGQLGQTRTKAKTRAELKTDGRADVRTELSEAQQTAVLSAVKLAIRNVAIKSPGRAATLKTSVLTNDIKERASPDTVTRIKLVLREEGMEWHEVARADGSSRSMLTPE
ncbi:MAG: hypothetical protein KBF81_07860 [Aquabacterium sp.]|nr:hypothetical protein [Aquabacterium sp.]MDQ5926719.1 hypothetical protein [Pseudomonadota bacterium]